MDGVSMAASLLGVGTAGCQIAIKLYTLATQVSTASQRISSISNDISLTSIVLQELGEFMTREAAEDGISIISQSGLEHTKNSVVVCENIFKEIEQAAKDASKQLRTRENFIGKVKLSRSEKTKWPFLQPSIETLRIDLREAKGTLMLLLQIMNLALSHKVAAIHQTTSTNVIEQREMSRAILAIQRQIRGNDTSQSKRLSMDWPSDDMPQRSSLGAFEKKPWSDEKPAPIQSPLIGSNAASPIGSRAFMEMYHPKLPHMNSLQQLKGSPTVGDARSDSQVSVDYAQQDNIEATSDQSSKDDNTTSPNATPKDPIIDNQREERKVLYLYLVKPVIRDDYEGISLTWIVRKVPVQQADILKHLSKDQEESFPQVIEAYQELLAHEHKAINIKVRAAGSGASVISLKRSHVDISHHGIFFNGVPVLQFILMSHTKKGMEPMITVKESMEEIDLARPTYFKVHREYLSPDTLDTYGLPWTWDKDDTNYIIIKQWLGKSDQEILFEHTRKLRRQRLHKDTMALHKERSMLCLIRKKNPHTLSSHSTRSSSVTSTPEPESAKPSSNEVSEVPNPNLTIRHEINSVQRKERSNAYSDADEGREMVFEDEDDGSGSEEEGAGDTTDEEEAERVTNNLLKEYTMLEAVLQNINKAVT